MTNKIDEPTAPRDLFRLRRRLQAATLDQSEDLWALSCKIGDVEDDILDLRSDDPCVLIEQIQIWNARVFDASKHNDVFCELYAEAFQTLHDNVTDVLNKHALK